jgi:CheY-like chemotaxis protein
MGTEIGEIKNILLVEDDAQDAELTLAALEENHLANKVAVVDDGEKALDYLFRRGEFKLREGGNPILVLLDLKMPKVSGLEVLKAIKADPHLKTIPVVVLSSSRERQDVTECYKHGVNAYVVKPVDFAEFVKAVNQLGIFWAIINEPPSPALEKETGVPSDRVTSPEAGQGRVGAPYRILVVDDEPDSRRLSAEVLMCCGYEVDSAVDGAAGWEAIQAKHYDLLIADNVMPKITGFEMIRMLREQGATLPVIMATGAIPAEELMRDSKIGITAILIKPYSIEELLEAVTKVLRSSNAAREQIDAAVSFSTPLTPASSRAPFN